MNKTKFLSILMLVLVAAFVLAPVTSTYAAPADFGSATAVNYVPGEAGEAAYYPTGMYAPALMATLAQTLSLNIDTTSLFDGAQVILDALTTPYMFIAGLGLGAAILTAIMAAVIRLRL